jgi:hypothetical protein
MVLVGLAVALLAVDGAALACNGTKHTASQKRAARGRIVSVNGNSITVAMHQHAKKGQNAAAANAGTSMTKTFTVAAGTQVAFVNGKAVKMATLADLKAGEEIAIEAPGGVAQKIGIMHGGHHKSVG